MNPTEIFEAIEAIARAPFDAGEFPFAFAEATDNAKATISKLRNGTTNKSDLPGGVLVARKFHYAPALRGMTDVTLDALRGSKRTATAKPAILIATDGETVAAEHRASGDTLHCRFDEIGDHFGFFLPAAGKERYRAVEENPIDVKATGKLARLYDALVKANPDWATDARRHEMNQLMMRLIFCLFAEDVGIFPYNQFSRLVFSHAGNKGEEAREAILAAFRAMNLPKDRRAGLPAWTAELEYVNGGLFASGIDAPVFDPVAFRYLKDAAALNWREINPDIFGSMIQSVADPKQRAELGMHYTSVPNIMKVIGPLFLDDLDAEIEKAWDRPNGLRRALSRMAGMRVFDPACGSGNFLVVSYRELRARETRILQRIAELEGSTQVQMWSAIPITNFYGIELDDFAAETAKLALFISEYQANARFGEVFGQMPATLPLKEAARITCGNALRLNWDIVCPPPGEGEQVFIAGNPPFLGDNSRTDEQNADMEHVLAGTLDSYKRIDFVSCWMFKAANYTRGRSARSALVATNSICQGQSVGALWPHILVDGIEIGFAHTSFKWRNNASANAAVICVIVGLRNESRERKRLFSGDLGAVVSTINAYLLDGPNLFIHAEARSIFGLPYMEYGNKPTDDGNLILSEVEKDDLLSEYPEASRFVKKFMGSDEVVNGKVRYCLWVPDQDADEAAAIPALRARFDRVAAFRAASKAAQTRPAAAFPHRFRQAQNWARSHAILVPSVSSERRPYLPVERVGADVIPSNLNQVLYDAPDWCLALIASRLHLVWIATVCGKLKSDFRYSNTMGWNTFPVPHFTQDQLEQLSASARRIMKTRWSHYPATIAELYDPERMPDDLRQAHKENDDLLESMYIGRPFRNDTERLEKLFKLYAARMKQEAAA
ncbi:class I SAM-dependent DNA methyltransferase [Halovulum dunhuangense]|uniref:site-specific DNA-methyltransferase (adenine-specific) n=1 Tax=Halovulum dunhuangense TaxID=1505036 RepID=A0A849L7X5_9RHOB|nr:class I SAM-dependent DNA methyltransferase [Halovulum dunhuangense]NNU82202.1 class I SAM-dependent DNA methyltransferase [Halovulum dunhuangense]